MPHPQVLPCLQLMHSVHLLHMLHAMDNDNEQPVEVGQTFQ